MLFCSPYRAHLLMAQLELVELGLLSEAVAIPSEVGADAHTEELDKVLRKIRRYVKKCKRNSRRQGPALVMKTKNLVECRKRMLTNFIECSNGTKKCMYCSAPARSLRHESGAKIFLKGLSKKLARVWMKAMREISSAGQDSVEEEAEKEEGEAEGETEKEEREGETEKEEREAEGEAEKEEGEAEKTGDLGVGAFTKQSYLTPLEVREHVKHLWENQRSLVNALIGCSVIAKGEGGGISGGGVTAGDEEGGGEVTPVVKHAQEISPADVFFLDVIPVPPSRFRPVSV